MAFFLTMRTCSRVREHMCGDRVCSLFPERSRLVSSENEATLRGREEKRLFERSRPVIVDDSSRSSSGKSWICWLERLFTVGFILVLSGPTSYKYSVLNTSGLGTGMTLCEVYTQQLADRK